MKESIFNYLKENNKLMESDNKIATNFIKKSNENEIVISGNKRGLILLADYLLEIALSDNSDLHIHLDADNFFDTADVNLVVRKND